MAEFITAHEAAKQLGYEYTYFVRDILNTGRIPGAHKWQDRWMVPADVKAEDVRRSPGRPSGQLAEKLERKGK